MMMGCWPIAQFPYMEGQDFLSGFTSLAEMYQFQELMFLPFPSARIPRLHCPGVILHLPLWMWKWDFLAELLSVEEAIIETEEQSKFRGGHSYFDNIFMLTFISRALHFMHI
jgi:hypothetical protein